MSNGNSRIDYVGKTIFHMTSADSFISIVYMEPFTTKVFHPQIDHQKDSQVRGSMSKMHPNNDINAKCVTNLPFRKGQCVREQSWTAPCHTLICICQNSSVYRPPGHVTETCENSCWEKKAKREKEGTGAGSEKSSNDEMKGSGINKGAK